MYGEVDPIEEVIVKRYEKKIILYPKYIFLLIITGLFTLQYNIGSPSPRYNDEGIVLQSLDEMKDV